MTPRALHLLGSAGEGGAETYFVDLVRALDAAGLPTSAALRANAGRERALAAAGVAYDVLPFSGAFDFTTRPAVARRARANRTDVLVAWMSRAARNTPKGPWRRVGRLGGYYDLKNYRGFDLLVANTEALRDWIVGRGWPAAAVRVIPNFAEAVDGPPVSRAALDTPEGVPVLLSMGRLHAHKAHDVSLKALTRLPDAILWIAGSGPLEAELKALAADLGVAERVRFLGWRDDPWALYRAADLCLFPSRVEPLGNVVIQAWVYGLPVVAAEAAGPAALIRHGEDGRLVPVDDPEALAGAAAALIADPTLRARLAQAGRARAVNEFSKGAVVARWKALYEELGAGRCAA